MENCLTIIDEALDLMGKYSLVKGLEDIVLGKRKVPIVHFGKGGKDDHIPSNNHL